MHHPRAAALCAWHAGCRRPPAWTRLPSVLDEPAALRLRLRAAHRAVPLFNLKQPQRLRALRRSRISAAPSCSLCVSAQRRRRRGGARSSDRRPLLRTALSPALRRFRNSSGAHNAAVVVVVAVVGVGVAAEHNRSRGRRARRRTEGGEIGVLAAERGRKGERAPRVRCHGGEQHKRGCAAQASGPRRRGGRRGEGRGEKRGRGRDETTVDEQVVI